MNTYQLINRWRNLEQIELFLVVLILGFLTSSIFFLLLIILNRIKKNRRNHLKEKYADSIENMLMAIAFDDKNLLELKRDKYLKRCWRRNNYKEQFLAELIKLHRLYEGETALRLRQFYRSSGLMLLSYKKLKSRRWYVQCAGIKELSEMECNKSAPIIRKFTTSKHDTLKMVAIIEFLHLFGMEGIALLKDYDQPINDWIQLNLLESIREKKIEEVPDFGYLLNSQNHNVVVLGLRLISLFQQHQHIQEVCDLQDHSVNEISFQAKNSLQHLLLIKPCQPTKNKSMVKTKVN